MSQDEPAVSARKAKRAQRDAERAEKHRDSRKKRQRSDILQDDAADEANGPEQDIQDLATAQVDSTQDDTVGKASKKRKRTQESGPAEGEERDLQPKQSVKKRRGDDGEDDKPKDAGKKRFIVFIGNLPYSTTDDTLDKHFAKLKPYTLRHRTDPKTKKSRGFAFLEFDNFDRMKTCLKLYHHSFFDPDNPGQGDPEAQEDYGYTNSSYRQKKKSKGRKINVELTAGGGGSTEARKEKIRTKNVRLEEQRTRRIEAERKEKERKGRKEGDVEADSKIAKADRPPTTGSSAPSHGEMHPSRLARMQ